MGCVYSTSECLSTNTLNLLKDDAEEFIVLIEELRTCGIDYSFFLEEKVLGIELKIESGLNSELETLLGEIVKMTHRLARYIVEVVRIQNDFHNKYYKNNEFKNGVIKIKDYTIKVNTYTLNPDIIVFNPTPHSCYDDIIIMDVRIMLLYFISYIYSLVAKLVGIDIKIIVEYKECLTYLRTNTQCPISF